MLCAPQAWVIVTSSVDRLVIVRGYVRAPPGTDPVAGVPVGGSRGYDAAMSGYVAMARVERGPVRAIAWDGAASAPPALGAPAVPASEPSATRVEPDDGVSLAEQLDRLRDQIRMATFYLTDPDSWR